jgi:hypothetical protein
MKRSRSHNVHALGCLHGEPGVTMCTCWLEVEVKFACDVKVGDEICIVGREVNPSYERHQVKCVHNEDGFVWFDYTDHTTSLVVRAHDPLTKHGVISRSTYV